MPSLLDLIGSTPLVELHNLSPNPNVRILAKLEGQNPSGSVKDRVARGLIEAAEARGEISPGDTIIEASSGNTAIALAMVARRKGYIAHVVLPRNIAPSITDVLELYGVSTIACDRCETMQSAIDLGESLAASRGWYPLRQFQDTANVEVHYRTTGVEIATAAPGVDVFIAGIGTGGTIMGVGRRLREANPNVRIVGIEPKLGEHLQGLRNINDGYRPPLLDLDQLDGRWLVDAAAAISAARTCARVEGVSAGISAGATLHVAMQEAKRIDRGTIVAMFSDSGWKYLPARPWEAAQEGSAELDEIHWW